MHDLNDSIKLLIHRDVRWKVQWNRGQPSPLCSDFSDLGDDERWCTKFDSERAEWWLQLICHPSAWRNLWFVQSSPRQDLSYGSTVEGYVKRDTKIHHPLRYLHGRNAVWICWTLRSCLYEIATLSEIWPLKWNSSTDIPPADLDAMQIENVPACRIVEKDGGSYSIKWSQTSNNLWETLVFLKWRWTWPKRGSCATYGSGLGVRKGKEAEVQYSLVA